MHCARKIRRKRTLSTWRRPLTTPGGKSCTNIRYKNPWIPCTAMWLNVSRKKPSESSRQVAHIERVKGITQNIISVRFLAFCRRLSRALCSGCHENIAIMTRGGRSALCLLWWRLAFLLQLLERNTDITFLQRYLQVQKTFSSEQVLKETIKKTNAHNIHPSIPPIKRWFHQCRYLKKNLFIPPSLKLTPFITLCIRVYIL